MNRHGFLRITCACPVVSVGNPAANAAGMREVLAGLPESDIVVFPELGLTGYTCADLFGQSALLTAALEGLESLAEETRGRAQLVVAGMPLAVGSCLFNTAVVLTDGRVLGIVPKQFLPNYGEFYEGRWFQGATGREAQEVELGPWGSVPFGIDLLFRGPGGVVVGVEVCEDLWVPVPPSARQALAGANVLLNLSASNETIGKPSYRRQLVVGQSGRCIAAYAYAGAGPSESTTDLVFGGHCLIAENGSLLGESRRVGDGQPLERGAHWVTRDVDIERLQHDRRVNRSFEADRSPRGEYRHIAFELATEMKGLEREVVGRPFVPVEDEVLYRRCAEIFGIQCAGLAKRVEQLPANTPLHIGVSGGLDSTLALLVAVKTCDLLGRDRRTIHGLTMPGFGTTSRTRGNAIELMRHLGTSAEEIDISQLALDTFQSLRHEPFGIAVEGVDLAEFREALVRVPKEERHDLVFENVQARLRTFLLMSRGFVVGTGDLSELALGWCTYNGDHMSMYNPNASVPKTLVKFLVEYAARNEFGAGPVRDTLLSIASTIISPELLPTSATGEIEQATEDTLGPYELHDFFLFQMLRNGFAPPKILFLAEHATFTKRYSPTLIRRTLRTFVSRFFQQQYKRSCLPDGPKVGTVSLSPRGDWRMPSDATAAAWLQQLDEAGA